MAACLSGSAPSVLGGAVGHGRCTWGEGPPRSRPCPGRRTRGAGAAPGAATSPYIACVAEPQASPTGQGEGGEEPRCMYAACRCPTCGTCSGGEGQPTWRRNLLEPQFGDTCMNVAHRVAMIETLPLSSIHPAPVLQVTPSPEPPALPPCRLQHPGCCGRLPPVSDISLPRHVPHRCHPCTNSGSGQVVLPTHHLGPPD